MSSKRPRVTLNEVIYLSMILISIGTLIQGYVNAVNQILVMIIIIAALLNDLGNKVCKTKFFLLVMSLVCALIAFVWGRLAGHITGARRLIYFPFLVLVYLLIIMDHTKCIAFFKKRKKWVDAILRLWLFFVGISIFIPSCYSTANGWGSFRYFYSFTIEGGARLGAMTIMIMSLILMQMAVQNDKRYFYYFFIPMYCAVMCGGRIYLALGIMEFMIGFYFYLNNRGKFWCLAVPAAVIIFILALGTALGAKLESVKYTENSIHNFYDTVSNGRFTPVVKGIKNFIKEPVIRKIFGNGYGFIEDETYNWAFNDVIDIGLVFGLFGLIIYYFCIHTADKMLHKSALPWFMKLGQWFCWFIPAMLGMYYRMTAMVIAIPFAFIACFAWKKDDKHVVREVCANARQSN